MTRLLSVASSFMLAFRWLPLYVRAAEELKCKPFVTKQIYYKTIPSGEQSYRFHI
jgi:hypothetical protein